MSDQCSVLLYLSDSTRLGGDEKLWRVRSSVIGGSTRAFDL